MTTERRTTRRALDVLDTDQYRLLYSGDSHRDPEIKPLTNGFETWKEALIWYQAAGVRTLGHVEKVIKPGDMLPLSGLLERLVDNDSREARYVRIRLVESLDEACDLAYKQFRERANEQLDEAPRPDGEDTKERNPLMRPAFRHLDQTQAAALDSLWSGFRSREEIGRWVRRLSAPTAGEKPAGLLEDIISSPVLLDALTDRSSTQAATVRYRFAVGIVLPSFFRAARSLHGSERSEIDSEVDKSETQRA